MLSCVGSLLLIGIATATLTTDVIIPHGKIRGFIDETLNGRQFIAYEGIPYARPPVGKYRFEEPQPVKPWHGTWEANTLHKCIQYNHYTAPGYDFVIGHENCLYVNVYTPNTKPEKLMDVIIFIHGGAYMFGSGASYGPKLLLDRDVVFITFNYRLGPLGFLSTEDEVVPGNNGLKDQLLALKWVKQNIKHFGGNPDSITVTGMSAGGASTHLHVLSPLSKGLFHRGISQSGTALNPWVLMEKAREKTQKLATLVGCPIQTSKEMIKCMKNRPAKQLVDSVKHFLPWLYNPFSPFGVVVDKWSPEPFVPEHPYAVLKRGKIRNLPWIFSHVQSEGLYPAADFIADEKHLKDIDNRWEELIPYILDFNNTVSANKKSTVAKEIRSEYFKGKPISKATFLTLVEVISDRLFIADIERAARLHAAASTGPVYYYDFFYRGANSKSADRSLTNENFGASHGDDTVYVLSTGTNVLTTDNDRKMSEILKDMWVSYAKNSKPKVLDIDWPKMSSDVSDPITLLHIESPNNIEIRTSTVLGNRKFWDTLPIKENKNLLAVKDEL